MKARKALILGLMPLLVIVFLTLIGGCASAISTGGPSGGGSTGGGGGSVGLVDGINYIDTTNFRPTFGFVISNSNVVSNAISTGYEVVSNWYGVFSNSISNWVLDLANGLTTTNSNTCISNYTNESYERVNGVYTNTFITNNFEYSNRSGSIFITNFWSNIGFVGGKFWCTNTNWTGYFTNWVTNWYGIKTNDVAISSNYVNDYWFIENSNHIVWISNLQNHVGFELTNVPADTLFCWNMNEGSGQYANDSAGNGTNLMLGATSGSEGTDPSWTNEFMPGYSVGCMTNALAFFSANSTYAWWEGVYNTGNNTNITVGFWMRTTNNTGILISTTNSNLQVHLAGNNIHFTLGNGVTYQVSSYSAAGITNGQWHYIACTYPNIAGINWRSRIYIDGVQVLQSTIGKLSIYAITNIYVGGSPVFGGYFNGLIDSVRIQNALDANITSYFTSATNAN